MPALRLRSPDGEIDQTGSVLPELNARPRSLLVLIVEIVIIVIAAVLGVSRRAMRLVDLVVPQLAIDAVPGEQLGVGAPLDRPAP